MANTNKINQNLNNKGYFTDLEVLLGDYIGSLNKSQQDDQPNIVNSCYLLFDKTSLNQLIDLYPTSFTNENQSKINELLTLLELKALERGKSQLLLARDFLSNSLKETVSIQAKAYIAYQNLLNFFRELTVYNEEVKNAFEKLLAALKEALLVKQNQIDQLNKIIEFYDEKISRLDKSIADKVQILHELIKNMFFVEENIFTPAQLKSFENIFTTEELNNHYREKPIKIDVNLLSRNISEKVADAVSQSETKSFDVEVKKQIEIEMNIQIEKQLHPLPSNRRREIMQTYKASDFYLADIVAINDTIQNPDKIAQVNSAMDIIASERNDRNEAINNKLLVEKARDLLLKTQTQLNGELKEIKDIQRDLKYDIRTAKRLPASSSTQEDINEITSSNEEDREERGPSSGPRSR